LLIAGAGAGAAIWLPDSVRLADAATRRKVPLARSGAFSTGVMSGDPAPDAVTLWSRLDGQEASRLRVTVEVAKDESFGSVVLRRDVPIARLRDHTCKVRVTGLQPDTRYFFRFATRDSSSPVGRTQTAPPPDSQRPIRIGYFSCQDFSSGYYGVYAKLLDLDCDLIVCGGDYIYDRIYSDSGYGGVREDKAGEGPDSVATTINHYRAKYRLYRTDPDLKELHRLVPLVSQWDDHEVTDNYVGTKDKEDMPDDGAEADKFDRNRILSGWRAWHEYMPAMRFGKSYRNYRNLRYGRNVELFMLDSRSYRDDQPCGGGTFVNCSDDAPRKFLGPEQATWFKDGLERSGAQWKVVGNQMMIMPFDIAGPVQVEVDSWQGYRHERNEICSHIKSKGIKDVVFLTGDIHTFFAGEVREFGRTGEPIGVEFVGGSTTSPGTAQTISQTAGGAPPPDLVKAVTDLAPVTNPWMAYAETRSHGAAFFQVSGREVAAQYLAMRDVTTKEGAHDVRVLQRFRVASGTPRIEVG
jgi:phosphodiesterase/alkaline phosphatase D-like protein